MLQFTIKLKKPHSGPIFGSFYPKNPKTKNLSNNFFSCCKLIQKIRKIQCNCWTDFGQLFVQKHQYKIFYKKWFESVGRNVPCIDFSRNLKSLILESLWAPFGTKTLRQSLFGSTSDPVWPKNLINKSFPKKLY